MRTGEKGTREQEFLRQRTEELLIEQATELLNQKELQNDAARSEAEAEADRLATFAKAEAARLATLAKTKADRHLARERLLLRHRKELLKLQQQHLHGNETNRSAIPEHGGIQPMQRDRHDYVEYELGAEDQIDWTPARGEN